MWLYFIERENNIPEEGRGIKKPTHRAKNQQESQGFFCVCNFNNKHNHSFFPAPLSVFLYLDLLPLLL